MAYTNKFKVYGESSSNLLTDTQYNESTVRSGGATANTVISSQITNTALKTPSLICVALINALISSAGTESTSIDLGLSDSISNLGDKFQVLFSKSVQGVLANNITINSHPLTSSISITKSDVGLGSVENTGDSATPTQSGTSKFTTGGAYTLKTNLEQSIASVAGDLSDLADAVSALSGGTTIDLGKKANKVVAAQGQTITNMVAILKSDGDLAASDLPISNVAKLSYSTTPSSPTNKLFKATSTGTLALSSIKDNEIVLTSRTINNKALSQDIEITKSDVGLDSVVNKGMDDTPTQSSANYVKSGGVFSALSSKADKPSSLPSVTKIATVNTSGNLGATVYTEAELSVNNYVCVKSELRNITNASLPSSLSGLISTQFDDSSGSGYIIKKSTSNLNDSEAKDYCKYMTGSSYVPNYTATTTSPKYHYVMMPDGRLYRLAWSSSTGMRLYFVNKLQARVSSPSTTKLLAHDSNGDIVETNVTFTGSKVDNAVNADRTCFTNNSEDSIRITASEMSLPSGWLPYNKSYNLTLKVRFDDNSSNRHEIQIPLGIFIKRDFYSSLHVTRVSPLCHVQFRSGTTTAITRTIFIMIVYDAYNVNNATIKLVKDNNELLETTAVEWSEINLYKQEVA